MKHRLYVANLETTSISGEEFHHAVRVVRVREGEHVELFDGKGHAAEAHIVTIGGNSLEVAVDKPIGSRESPLKLHLAAAIVQLEKFELVLQKATELGVASITPLITDRVELRPERYRGKSERWRKIVLEAVKQCGRAVIPRLDEPAPFDEIVGAAAVKLFFEADVEPSPAPASVEGAMLFIGPEVGWSEREIDAARDAACIFQRMGPRRLRAETAAISALAIISARYGDI
jgi:16S rRNA (uracil1498-N3)-methyltransferase